MLTRRVFGTFIALASAAAAQAPPPDLLSGKWWTRPAVVRRLGLSEDQQRRIDRVYQENRLRLIDLHAALDREEALLDPLLASDHPQEPSVLVQIDRIAAARSELEKATARMLFGFRLVLTPEQWRQLQSRNIYPGNMPPARSPR